MANHMLYLASYSAVKIRSTVLPAWRKIMLAQIALYGDIAEPEARYGKTIKSLAEVDELNNRCLIAVYAKAENCEWQEVNAGYSGWLYKKMQSKIAIGGEI